MTFVNHGCNGTFNIDDKDLLNEDDPWGITEQNATPEDRSDDRDVYDPFVARHLISYDSQHSNALRDIKAGEEILCNYLHFTDANDEWFEEVEILKKICNGEEVGLITQAEEEEVRAAGIQHDVNANSPGNEEECSTCEEL